MKKATLLFKVAGCYVGLNNMTVAIAKYIENAPVLYDPVTGPSIVVNNIPGCVSKLFSCQHVNQTDSMDYLKWTMFWLTVNVESEDASGTSHKTVNQSLWLDTNEVGAGDGQNWNV